MRAEVSWNEKGSKDLSERMINSKKSLSNHYKYQPFIHFFNFECFALFHVLPTYIYPYLVHSRHPILRINTFSLSSHSLNLKLKTSSPRLLFILVLVIAAIATWAFAYNQTSRNSTIFRQISTEVKWLIMMVRVEWECESWQQGFWLWELVTTILYTFFSLLYFF